MGEPRLPPTFMFIQTNQRCNLRCLHCNFWKLDDNMRSKYLPTERKQDIMEEFAELGGQVIVTCGGEPMLDIDDYFDLMGRARSIGLRAFSVINGTRVHNEARAERMILEGPTEVTVSLDSHLEAEHDRMRGVQRSFKVATKALRLLVAARDRIQGHLPRERQTRVYAMTIVHEHNYRELDAFFDFALHGLKVDKLKLNILQPSFGVPKNDDFFDGEQIRDTKALREVADACDEKYGLNLNPHWKRQAAMYFDTYEDFRKQGGLVRLGWSIPHGTKEHICNTYDRNIMLDLWGVARLCFSHEFQGMKIEKRGDLRQFWHEFSLPSRQKMLTCNRPCGISHSVRREPATIREPGDPALIANRRMTVDQVPVEIPEGFQPVAGCPERVHINVLP